MLTAVEHPAAVNQYLEINGLQDLSYRDVVGVHQRVLNRSIPVNYVAPGETVPGLPSSMSTLLAGMDFNIIVDSTETARTFEVQQTSLEEAIRGML